MNIAEIFERDLRGHAYVSARGLSPDTVRGNQHTCETCALNEKLPAVLNILKAERARLKETRKQIRRIA